MKYHILFKILAIVLCTCALAGCIGSALGIIVLAQEGFYEDNTPEALYAQQFEYKAHSYAKLLAIRYAGKTLGGCPDDLLDRYLQNNFSPSTYNIQDSCHYLIGDVYGNTLTHNFDLDAIGQSGQPYTYSFAPSYPVLIGHSQTGGSAEATEGTIPDSFIPDTVSPAPAESEYLHK